MTTYSRSSSPRASPAGFMPATSAQCTTSCCGRRPRGSAPAAIRASTFFGASAPARSTFGRRRIDMWADDIEFMVAYQIGAVNAMVPYVGEKETHLKPHERLNNVAG